MVADESGVNCKWVSMESEVIAFFTSQKGLSSIGLGLDIVGALLIWKFGIPSITDREGGDALAIKTSSTKDREEKHLSRVFLYDVVSNSGVWVLILGFSLQLMANWAS